MPDDSTSNARAFGKKEVGNLFRNSARAVGLFNLSSRNF